MAVGLQLEDSGFALDESVWAGADGKRIVGDGYASERVFASHDWELEIGEEGRMWLTENEENRP
jgi:hypothetical protein